MDDERYVTRREWDLFHSHEDELDIPRRVDRIERLLDRFTGPVVVIVLGLGTLSTIANIATAIVVVASR